MLADDGLPIGLEGVIGLPARMYYQRYRVQLMVGGIMVHGTGRVPTGSPLVAHW